MGKLGQLFTPGDRVGPEREVQASLQSPGSSSFQVHVHVFWINPCVLHPRRPLRNIFQGCQFECPHPLLERERGNHIGDEVVCRAFLQGTHNASVSTTHIPTQVRIRCVACDSTSA